MKKEPPIIKFLRYLVIIGNGVFVLWILYNGMEEGFKANPVQIVSYLSLIFLLILNTFFLFRSQSKK